jgi:uncharacterized glyoxalase superfamily metalloenzyme YdcJ
LTKKPHTKGLGADSEEKREPVSDIDTAVVDSLKALDPERPIREARARFSTSVRDLFAIFGMVAPGLYDAQRAIWILCPKPMV